MVQIRTVLPALELDRLGIAHRHITSDVVEDKRISVTSGSLSFTDKKLTQVTNIAKLGTYNIHS